MKIIIQTIPHSAQRYPTVGDWTVDLKNGSIDVSVSDMGNIFYEFLIVLHELIELHLCLQAGISQVQVDAFDIAFEQERIEGKHSPEAEAGDDPKAPYRREHFFATNIERLVAAQLGIDWEKYNQAVIDL